ncbi:MAG: hypothetical protein NC086_10220 [Alistipes sp.]|nr:hypothetical protein [Alistipes sp.]
MAETETEAVEATGEAALAETENAEQKFWEAADKFYPAVSVYWGDEEKGITGKMELFQKEAEEGHVPAKDSDKAVEHVEPIRNSGSEAIAAYNDVVICFEAVKAAYENCDEAARTQKEGENLSIEEGYANVRDLFEDLKGDLISQAIVDYHVAWCNSYGDIRTFIGLSSDYIKSLDEYKTAVIEEKDNEKILKLYQKVLERRIAALNAYELFKVKSDTVLDAKNAISESDKASSFYDFIDGSFGRIYSNIESGEEIYKDLQIIPEVPVLSQGNTPEITINENADEILDKIDLTAEEKTAIEAGNTSAVTMTVDDVKPNDTEQSLIEETRGNYFVGMNLNIEVSLQIGSSISRKITDMRNPIDISVKIPDELLNKDTTKNRIYAVIRIHNGVATIIEGTFNSTSGEFTFASDGFSTYSIIYKDEPLLDGNEGESKEENNEEDSDDQEALPAGAGNGSNGQVSPKTGDNTPIGFLLTLFIASTAGIVFFWKKKICIED